MGWDVIVLRTPPLVETVSQLAEQSTEPLGRKDHVLALIATALPDSDVSDPGWIVVNGDGYSIEISLIEAEQVEALMLHVHGSTTAIDVIEHLCQVGGWRAVDSATGQFLDFDSPQRDAGFNKWKGYQGQITDKYGGRRQR